MPMPGRQNGTRARAAVGNNPMRFVEFTQPIQEAELDYSDKAEALKAWETKYNKYKNELGQELPRGYIRAMTDTGIESDSWEASEWKKVLKVVGKEDYDWEDEDYLKAISLMPQDPIRKL